MPEKMEIKKFDPVVRKHVIYKEAKSNNLALINQKTGLFGFFHIVKIKKNNTELPEVETTLNGIRPHLQNAMIEK